MSSQALEQMLDNVLVPTIRQDRMYGTIDQYAVGTTALYSFDPPKPLAPFFPTNTGFGVNIPKPLDEIKDYHETFKIDRYDNIYGGHSSITPIGGDKFRINHDK